MLWQGFRLEQSHTALWESIIGSGVLKKKIVPNVLETFRKHSRILVKYRKML